MVTVILVAYEGKAWLPACTSTLPAASARLLHLVLVDNAGDNGIDALELSDVRLEVLPAARPLGFAEANNLALAQARELGEWVLFLNQDTVSPPRWIDVCLRVAEQQERVGAISPFIRTYDDDGWDPSFLACLDGRPLPEEHTSAASFVPVDHVPAPALLVRTDVLQEVGPFDPIYGSYYEDYDLCHRIRQAGWRVGFAPAARVQHYSGSVTTTPERERRRMRQIIRNRTIYQARTRARGWQLVRRVLADAPRRLARGLARTPSSQPPSVTLGAYLDLARIAPRLLSAQRDEAAWQSYLATLGWPPSLSAE